MRHPPDRSPARALLHRILENLGPLHDPIPWASCCLVGCAALATIFPALASGLEDRRTLELGEIWRPFTGHLTHRGVTHAALNVLLFFPLALWREHHRGALRFLSECFLLAAAVALGVRLAHSDWESYRGLSGVVYGLVTLVLLSGAHSREQRARQDAAISPLARHLTWGRVLVLFLAVKTVLETFAGGWLLGGSWLNGSLEVRFLPGAHLAGMAMGAWLHLSSRPRRDTQRGLSEARARPQPGGRECRMSNKGTSNGEVKTSRTTESLLFPGCEESPACVFRIPSLEKRADHSDTSSAGGLDV